MICEDFFGWIFFDGLTEVGAASVLNGTGKEKSFDESFEVRSKKSMRRREWKAMKRRKDGMGWS
jgi:hypothetical protein